MANDEISSKDGLPYPKACQGWSAGLPHWRADLGSNSDFAAIDSWIANAGSDQVLRSGFAVFLVRDGDVADLIDQFGKWVIRAQRVNLVQR